MPGLTDWPALIVALCFMLGAFGQIPINDYMIGKMASGAARARIYAVRYVVSFTVLAATLPLIAFVHAVKSRAEAQTGPPVTHAGTEALGEPPFYAQLLAPEDVDLLVQGAIRRLCGRDLAPPRSEEIRVLPPTCRTCE